MIAGHNDNNNNNPNNNVKNGKKSNDSTDDSSTSLSVVGKALYELDSVLLSLIRDIKETTQTNTMSKDNLHKRVRKNRTPKVLYYCSLLAVIFVLNTISLLSVQKKVSESTPMDSTATYQTATSTSTAKVGSFTSQNNKQSELPQMPPVKVSLVILTYKKRKQFRALIRSIKPQVTNFRYEVIIANSGCLFGLYEDIETIFVKEDDLRTGSVRGGAGIDISGGSGAGDMTQQNGYYRDFKYLELCDNPGYSVGNNRAYALADKASEYVLFLNDDLVMRDSHFVQSMVDLFDLQSDTAGAVGCTLLNEKGDTILETGSNMWSDGSAQGYGRDRKDLDADDLQHTRPVDFISGACLMVEMNLLQSIGGFDGDAFPAYYEDTDMQMKIQHVYHKKVWLQPRAVALHAEHGSFGASNSHDLMVSSHKVFQARWETHLRTKHIYPGPLLPDGLNRFQSFRASDTRGRISTATDPNVLYLVEYIPYKLNGNGRQFDNLMALKKMGLRITLLVLGMTGNAYCHNDQCDKQLIQQSGIEVIEATDETTLPKLLVARPFYYNIILINRKSTYELFNKTIDETEDEAVKDIVQHCAIIYDTNALQFREGAKIHRLLESSQQRENVRHLPGIQQRYDPYHRDSRSTYNQYQKDRDTEVSIFKKVDTIVAVSNVEENIILHLLRHEPNNNNYTSTSTTKENENVLLSTEEKSVWTIGHGLDVNDTIRSVKPNYSNRNGILFVGSFLKNDMYYNGDAIYDFLHEVYPLILEDLPTMPLTIVGRDIPQILYDYVMNNIQLDHLVTLLESPEDTSSLYDHTRLVIAPHLYGSGIQYKVTEAMAAGVPTVISSDTARNFGAVISNATCIGETPLAFKECVVAIYDDVNLWNEIQSNGLQYIEQYHKRGTIESEWKNIISSTTQRKLKSKYALVELDNLSPIGPESQQCKKIDASYVSRYQDVKDAIATGTYQTGLDHFYAADPSAGYIYNVEHEEAYLQVHLDVNEAVKAGIYSSGWHHFQIDGSQQMGYEYSPEDDKKYRSQFHDVDQAISQGILPMAWIHFQQYGKHERRLYGCW